MITENPYIQGNFFVGGKYCKHCLGSGVVCRASGLLLSGIPLGKDVAEVDGTNFEIPGKLQNCKIATGKVSMNEGISSIRTATESKKQEVVSEAVKNALKNMKNNRSTEIPSNNWT